jgi:outer membrane protein assembly factor BamB
VLYVASVIAKLYALDCSDRGEEMGYGADERFWTSPVVFEGLALLGDRGGRFHAVKAASGESAWTFDTRGPILQTASLSEDGTRVLFASEDMHAYCLERTTGKLLWRSRKMAGLSVRDYFPVVAGGLAFFTTHPVRVFHRDTLNAQDFLVKPFSFWARIAVSPPPRTSRKSRTRSCGSSRMIRRSRPFTPSASPTAASRGSPRFYTLPDSTIRRRRPVTTSRPGRHS